jgi:hypothetical protein
MFTRLAKSGLVRFWPVQPRRVAPGLHAAGLSNRVYCNDNLPGFRRPAAAGKRRSPTPALACHWFNRNGRLECRWQTEPAVPAESEELDSGPANNRTFRPNANSIAHRRLSGLALTVRA